MATLADVEKLITDKQEQLRNLQEELHALLRVQRMLAPERAPSRSRIPRAGLQQASLPIGGAKPREGSISAAVVEILKEAAEPMAVLAVVKKLKDFGNQSDEATIQSVIYRDAKKRGYYNIVSPGMIALP